MKFSEAWLRTMCDPPIASAALCDRLTMVGLEVEEAAPAAPPFDKVVVGRIEKVLPHPDADRLRVCTVDVGTRERLHDRLRRAECSRRDDCAGARWKARPARRARHQARVHARRGIAGHAVLGEGAWHRRGCERPVAARCVACAWQLGTRRARPRRHADHAQDHAQPRRLPVGRGPCARSLGDHARTARSCRRSPRRR